MSRGSDNALMNNAREGPTDINASVRNISTESRRRSDDGTQRRCSP